MTKIAQNSRVYIAKAGSTEITTAKVEINEGDIYFRDITNPKDFWDMSASMKKALEAGLTYSQIGVGRFNTNRTALINFLEDNGPEQTDEEFAKRKNKFDEPEEEKIKDPRHGLSTEGDPIFWIVVNDERRGVYDASVYVEREGVTDQIYRIGTLEKADELIHEGSLTGYPDKNRKSLAKFLVHVKLMPPGYEILSEEEYKKLKKKEVKEEAKEEKEESEHNYFIVDKKKKIINGYKLKEDAEHELHLVPAKHEAVVMNYRDLVGTGIEPWDKKNWATDYNIHEITVTNASEFYLNELSKLADCYNKAGINSEIILAHRAEYSEAVHSNKHEEVLKVLRMYALHIREITARAIILGVEGARHIAAIEEKKIYSTIGFLENKSRSSKNTKEKSKRNTRTAYYLLDGSDNIKSTELDLYNPKMLGGELSDNNIGRLKEGESVLLYANNDGNKTYRVAFAPEILNEFKK